MRGKYSAFPNSPSGKALLFRTVQKFAAARPPPIATIKKTLPPATESDILFAL